MTIKAELEDGRVLEFPDDTKQEVIQKTVKSLISKNTPNEKNANTIRKNGLENVVPEQKTKIPESGVVSSGELLQTREQIKPGESFKRGIQDFGEGIKQLALEAGESLGVVDKGSADQYTQEVEQGRAKFNQQFEGGNAPARALGSALPVTMIPGGKIAQGVGATTKAIGLTGLTKSAADLAVTGGVIGGGVGGAQFVPEGESRLNNLIQGAKFGAAVPAAAIGATGVSGVTRRAIRGGSEGLKKLRENIDVFRRAGTSPSVGEATGSKSAQGAETLLKAIPGSSGRMDKLQAAKQEQIGTRVSAITNNLSNKLGSESTGRVINKGINNFTDRFNEKAGQLFDKLDDYIPSDKPIAIENTLLKLNELTKPIKGAEKTSEVLSNPKLGKITESLSADVATTNRLPYQAVKELRTKVGRMLSSNELITEAPKAELKQLYGALTNDMRVAASETGKDAINAFNRANGYWKAGIQRIDDHLQKISVKDYEQAYLATLQGTKEGATRLRAVKRSLDPTEWESVVATTVNRLGKALPGKQNELSEVFSTETFLTNWNRLSPEAKNELLSGTKKLAQYKNDIEAIAAASSRIRDSINAFPNPSGTTQQAAKISAGSIAAYNLAVGDLATPTMIAMGAVSANAASRLMTNPAFVNWLAKSTEISASASQASKHIAKLAGIYSASSDDEKDAILEYSEVIKDQKPRLPARKAQATQ